MIKVSWTTSAASGPRQHRVAVGVEGRGVPVIRPGDSIRVTCDDSRNHVTVLHALTVVRSGVKLSQNDISGYQNEISGQHKHGTRRGGYPGTGNVKEGVGVAVAVEVDVGVGVAVPSAPASAASASGSTGAEDVADGDGFALVGEAEGGATGGALMTAGALVAGDRLGDIPPAGPVLAVTEALAVPGGLPVRPRPGAGCASR